MPTLDPTEQLKDAQVRVAGYRAIYDRLIQMFAEDHPTVMGIAKCIETAESDRDFWQGQIKANQGKQARSELSRLE